MHRDALWTAYCNLMTTEPQRIIDIHIRDGKRTRYFKVFALKSLFEGFAEHGCFWEIENGGAYSQDMWYYSEHCTFPHEQAVGDMVQLILLDVVSGWHPSSHRQFGDTT